MYNFQNSELNYTVSKLPNTHIINKNKVITSDNSFFTYREDIDEILGDKLGKVYKVIPNSVMIEIAEKLIETNLLSFDKELVSHIGSHAFINLKYNEPFNVNDDESYSYITLGNSFDGSLNLRAIATNKRLVCENQWAAIIGTSNYQKKIRHSKNLSKKNVVEDIVALGLAQQEHSKKIMQQLSSRKVTDLEMKKILELLVAGDLNADDENVKASTKAENITSKIEQSYYYGAGQQNIIGTKWGVYNAITNFYTHTFKTNTEEEKFYGLLHGTPNKKINKGLALLLAK
jgi:phage/plasmid-like protein (TIGR03299 family)